MSDFDIHFGEAIRGLPRTGPSIAETERFQRRAMRAGLVDVAYGQADSPLGPLTLVVTERGLLALAYPDRALEDVLAPVTAKVSPRVLEVPKRTDPVRRELERYFDGKLKRFETPVDWALTGDGFFNSVLRATSKIGFGKTRSYGEIARAAGNERAVRATGNGLGSNPIPVVVPCHRVLRSGGRLGGYTGGLERKQFLLSLEGVTVGDS